MSTNPFDLLYASVQLHKATYLSGKQLEEQRKRYEAEWEAEKDARMVAGAMFAAGDSPCFRIEDLGSKMKSWLESNYTCNKQLDSDITRCCLKQPIKQ